MRRSILSVLVLPLVLTAVAGGDVAVAAVAYPPLSVSATSLEKGDTLAVSGSGCFNQAGLTTVGYDVELVNGDARIAFTDTPPYDPATGSWTASTTIGADFPAGRYVVEARCWDTMEGVPYGPVAVTVLPEGSPPISGTVAVEPAGGPAGTPVTIAASGFYGPLEVGFFLNPGRRFLGSAPSNDADGSAVLTTTMPGGLAPGTYEVLAQGTNGAVVTMAGAFTVAPVANPFPAEPAAPAPTEPVATSTTLAEATTTTAAASTTSSSSTTSTTRRPTSTTRPDDLEVVDEGGGGGGAGWLLGGGAAVVAAAIGAAWWRRRGAGDPDLTPMSEDEPPGSPSPS